jgi:hypothetical protein
MAGEVDRRQAKGERAACLAAPRRTFLVSIVPRVVVSFCLVSLHRAMAVPLMAVLRWFWLYQGAAERSRSEPRQPRHLTVRSLTLTLTPATQPPSHPASRWVPFFLCQHLSSAEAA